MTSADSTTQIDIAAQADDSSVAQWIDQLARVDTDTVVFAIADRGAIRVPSALAQSVGFRSQVMIGAHAFQLLPADVWTDFLLRLVGLAPLHDVLCELEREPSVVTSVSEPRMNGVDIGAIRSSLAVACASAQVVNAARPRVRRVARELLKPAAQRTNQMLRNYPYLQNVAVDFLRRGGVRHFPYPSLNQGLATALVVAYGFPPYTDTSGLVFARRTYERAEVVDVISKDVGERARYDEGSLEIVQEFVASHVLIDGPPTFDNWTGITTYVERGMDAFHQLAKDANYQRIYSRSMWPASHFLAAMIKLAHPELTWIAEFSDPMRRDAENNNRNAPISANQLTTTLTDQLAKHGVEFPAGKGIYPWTEDLAYRFADELLFTNEQQVEFMTSYLSNADATLVQQKSMVEHHPIPAPSFYSRSDLTLAFEDDLINIGYFGVFYSTRGLGSITSALQLLTPTQRARVRLHVFCPRPAEMTQLAADLGISDVVVARPYLAYFDFLHVISHLDCLVVDDFATAATHPINPYLPSKWSDYVGSGAPVWRVFEPGSVLSAMTSAYSSELGDVAGASAVLTELLADPADMLPDYM